MTSSFERVHLAAQHAIAAYNLQPVWKAEYAQEWESADGVYRPTETQVFESLHRRYRARRGGFASENALHDWIDLFKEVFNELRAESDERARIQRQKLPLRDLLRRQGKTLEWYDLGKRAGGKSQIESVVVPLTS